MVLIFLNRLSIQNVVAKYQTFNFNFRAKQQKINDQKFKSIENI